MLSSDITWQMIHTRWQIYFYLVGHARYIKILTDSEVLGSKLQIFHDSIHCLAIRRRDWAQKPN